MKREFPESQQTLGETLTENAVKDVEKSPAVEQATNDAPPPEKYTWVRFHIKSRPDDEDDVVLSVQGDVLLMKRNEKVPIPERYVECAKNARYPHFKQLPNEARKIVGEIRVYPFEILGPATEKEYLEWKAEGTKLNQEAAADASRPK